MWWGNSSLIFSQFSYFYSVGVLPSGGCLAGSSLTLYRYFLAISRRTQAVFPLREWAFKPKFTQREDSLRSPTCSREVWCKDREGYLQNFEKSTKKRKGLVRNLLKSMKNYDIL
jgi:hypothetical protein